MAVVAVEGSKDGELGWWEFGKERGRELFLREGQRAKIVSLARRKVVPLI